ncbi:MAG: hypothetical protein JO103_14115 [Candidatus Eremiobacteraeota bacterium]|nr:hypothetical protein [Candidatus Eremiobacteraeota bacterium]
MRRRFFSAAVGLCVGFAAVAPAGAVTGPGGSFVAVRAAKAPALDAALTDPAWDKAVVATGMQTVTTQQPSRFAARFMLLYDDANLYVGIKLTQAGAPITASQTSNDVGFGLDDFAGIGIDPSANGGQVYFFMATPRGTRYQQSTESSRFAPPWTAVAATTADGWNAMLVIPLRVLRRPSSSVQTWRFDFVRRIAALNLNESWAYDPVMNDGGGGTTNFPQPTDARFWPKLTDLRLVATPARRPPRAEVYGLASAGADRRRFAAADGSFVDTGVRNAGADVVVPVTGTAAFVAAFAPDFSNVEVDQQTIAPQEFRRALTEYRPFFSQGANFFSPVSTTGVNAPPNLIFYSPSVGPFDRGLKLEGTQGFESFGALEAQGAGFDDMVFGYKHQTPNRAFGWSLDGVATHHALGNDTIDPRAGNDSTWQAQVGGRNPRTGFVYSLDYAHEAGTFVSNPRLAYKSEDFVDVHQHNYEIYTSYRDIGPEYAPVLGYTQNSDMRGPQAFYDYTGTLAPHGWIKRAELFLEADRYTDGSGAVHQADSNINLDLQFKDGLHLYGGPYSSFLRTYDNGLVGYPTYTGGVTRTYNQHNVGFGWKEGTPAPYTATYQWGPFGDLFLQQVTLATSRTIGTRWSVGAEVDGTRERPSFGGAPTGQWLRRITLGETLDANTNFSLALRGISGTGGFAQPGVNLAGSFHHRFRNDGELFINYGTPAAPTTLQRVVVKYVLRTGGGAGT